MTTLSNNAEMEMASSPLNSTTAQSSRWQAYIELTKLRISVMVLITFAVAAVLAAHTAGQPIVPLTLFGGLIGMLLVAASGNAMNMYIERYTDFLMPRTAQRPLPAQKLTSTEVALFAAVTIGSGTVILFEMVNWQTAACGVANWILYAFIYTPLKRKHWSNTEVGAVAGALPILMGSLASTQTVGLIGWAFFGVLFLWQFPHFMAIAWKYRDQYRAGGMQMLTVTEPTGRAAGRKAVLTAALLIMVSLIPAYCARTWFQGGLLIVLALIFGWYYLQASLAFNRDRNDVTARKLMRVSLLYLPLYMGVLLITCLT